MATVTDAVLMRVTMAAMLVTCPDKTPLRAAIPTRILLVTNRRSEVNRIHKQDPDKVQRVTYGASQTSLTSPSFEFVLLLASSSHSFPVYACFMWVQQKLIGAEEKTLLHTKKNCGDSLRGDSFVEIAFLGAVASKCKNLRIENASSPLSGEKF